MGQRATKGKRENLSSSKRVLVSLAQLSTYEASAVATAIEEVMMPLGGMGAFVTDGNPVILKPNLLSPSVPEEPKCTHPAIIRSVAELSLSNGARKVIVTDSPSIGTATRCARKLGLESCQLFEVCDADDPISDSTPESPFHHLNISERMRDAEILINLPKAKTHGNMVITGAVKNTYGAVVGHEKAQWHFRAGRDPLAFAKLIVHIHEAVKPTLNILDAVVCMEGNGPGAGSPRHMGLLLASTNAYALDLVLAHLWGLDGRQVPLLKLALEQGLTPPLDDIQVEGGSLEELRPRRPWVHARPMALSTVAGPEWFAPIADRLLSLRPRIHRSDCIVCGQCLKSCAAGAMSIEAQGGPMGSVQIDKKKCISCFCCQEMCPTGAIDVATGPVGKILDLLSGK